MAVRALHPPPLRSPISGQDGKLSPEWAQWMQTLYDKTGQASNTAPLSVTGTSDNITGILPSSHAAANLSFNNSNNVTADSIDVDAANCTVRVYGPGGIGSDWERYEASDTGYVTKGPYPATHFTNQAYNTIYYIAFNPSDSSYIISSDYKQTLADGYYWVAQVAPNAAFGGSGAISGGGGTGAGGSGGGGAGRLR